MSQSWLSYRAGGVWKLRTPVLSHEREHFIGTSEIENTYFIFRGQGQGWGHFFLPTRVQPILSYLYLSPLFFLPPLQTSL